MQTEIERFLASKQNNANTVAAYHNDLSQFHAYIQGRRRAGPPATWNDIGTDDLVDYVLHLKQREYAPATVARKIAAVKSFFQFLVGAQIIGNDPSATIEAPHFKKTPPHIVEQDKVEQLLSLPASGGSPRALRDTALLELLYDAGLRVSEIAALDIEDIALGQATVTTQDRRRLRTIQISPRVMAALTAYLETGRPRLARYHHPGERALFINHHGERLTRQGLWLIVKSYAGQLGDMDKITPHNLRHASTAHRQTGRAVVADPAAR